jgi:hypothetical protein
MRRFLLLLGCTCALSAQTSAPTLDKPPQDVDDALRTRITRFYDYHVARKFRLCEELILESSKDDFYVLTKPQLDSYRIGNIEYSENFTKAKVIIVGVMPILMPMAAARVGEQPFASYWAKEDGVWYWYYNKQPAEMTPFGRIVNKPSEPGASALPGGADVNVAFVQSALKIDRNQIELAGDQPQIIKVTNTLPGPASLVIDCPLMPMAQTGIAAKFDKSDLKGNESVALTLTAGPNVRPGPLPLRIMVKQTYQVLDLTVVVKR